MRFAVISSGSKANCTFVEAAGTRFLIDCGLSCREASLRLGALGIDPLTIKGIIITHEHYDHVRGIAAWQKKHNVTAYATRGTGRAVRDVHRIEYFKSGEPFWIDAVQINPFSITHDAADPVGFAIQAEGLKFSQATDLGRVTSTVRDAILNSNALVLESNHDPEMLRSCGYTPELKQRIASSFGHLSNDSAGQLLSDVMHSGLLQVVLGHISENSNTPDLALKTVKRHLEGREPAELFCGSVHHPSALKIVGEVSEIRQVG